MGGGGDEGMIPSKILSKRCLNPPPQFFLFFFFNFSAAMLLFANLQNSTVGNTGTDAAGLVHVHHLVELGLRVVLLENSRNIDGPILFYSQLVL